MTSIKPTPPVVRFYRLSTPTTPARRLQLAVQLAEKCQQERLKTLIICPNDEIADEMDCLLWTAKPASFIPHCRFDDPLAERANLLITLPYQRVPTTDAQIDLSYEARPDVPRGCGRILEIVDDQPEVLASARARFLVYRSRGWQPITHEI